MREKGKLFRNLELRNDVSEGAGQGLSTPLSGVGQHWELERKKPQEVAVGPDRRQEDAKSKLHPAQPNLCWVCSYLTHSKIIDYLL